MSHEEDHIRVIAHAVINAHETGDGYTIALGLLGSARMLIDREDDVVRTHFAQVLAQHAAELEPALARPQH